MWFIHGSVVPGHLQQGLFIGAVSVGKEKGSPVAGRQFGAPF